MKRLLLLITAILMMLSFRGTAQIQVVHDVTCNGQPQGALIATPTGWGTAPFVYTWNTGDTTQSIHNLMAGTYTVTIMDVLLIDSVFTVTLGEPAPIMIIPAVTPSDCDGHDDGSVTLAVSGGMGPYTYSWREINTDSVYATQNIFNVRGGDYVVEVTDTWGCTVSLAVNIPNIWTVPVSFVIDSFVCNGLMGSMMVQADSADSLQYYNYSWNTPFGNTSITSNDTVFNASGNFLAGSYLIITTELATGCANYSRIIIDQTDAPLVVTESVIHNQCFGDLAGSITLFPTGGLPLPDYHCVWTGPSGFTSTAFTIGGLNSGDYAYTVTDDSACSYSGTVRIEPLLPLQGNISLTGVSCDEGQYGKAFANFSGGSGLLSYLWSNGETTSSVPLLASGTYSVTVTDTRNCQVSDTITVSEGDEICLFIPNMVTPNGDHYNDVFKVEGACDMDEFFVAIYTRDGKEVFSSPDCTFSWDPRDGRETATGMVFYYYIRVVNGNNVAEYKNSLNVNY